MRYKFILFLLFAAGFCFSGIRAQVKQVTVIDDLETFAPGEGIIQIISDPKIMELIGTLSPDTSTNETNYVKTNGFRIQVFMSNDPKTARKELNDKGNLIYGVFSDEIKVYIEYSAPNWKLFAGDFLTKEEAEVFRQKMLKAIPQLGKEMYIIQDKVHIPIQRTN